MQHFLLDLADVCRAAGLTVNEGDGRWHFRARSSGGYAPGRPTHVMWHHTASGPSWDGQRDYDYLATGKLYAPISNLYIDRRGVVWIIAGGATNTNGTGQDVWGGGVPTNRMNEYAIGVEMGNNGVGEVWPAAQRQAAIKLAVALHRAYNIPIGHNRAHFEWRPAGKIDPAGPPSPWARADDRYLRWNMDQFRGDIWLASITPPPPPPTGPPTSGVPMRYIEPPARGFDTRPPWPAKLKPGTHWAYLRNFAGIPVDAEAVEITVTVVDPASPGFLTVWSGAGGRPGVSNLNYEKGQTICNTTTTRVQNGKFAIYTHAETHLIIDAIGYQKAEA